MFYYFSDHLKTASVITDSTGNIKSESDYYPWGGELQFVANDSNHYKFTGKERDSESGLDYFGARYYSNGLGRFITPDWDAKAAAVPYAEFADPQSLNLYTYVRNIPTTRPDVDGHFMGALTNEGFEGFESFWETLAPGPSDSKQQRQNQQQQQQPQQQTQQQPQNQQPAPQPVPTNPDGTPKSPGDDVPKPPDGKGPNGEMRPNDWRQVKGSKDRPVKWVPQFPIPGQSQPSVSWDPNGHWDHKDGFGNTTRWLPGGGGQVDHDNNPIKQVSISPGVRNAAVQVGVWATVGAIAIQVLRALGEAAGDF